MTTSFVARAEGLAHDVAVEAARTVNQIVDMLMPDGRPFGQEKMSLEAQVADYIETGWRDDPMVASKWMTEKATIVIPDMLKKFGLTPQQIAAVHPWDIAISAAIAKSAKMEKEILKRQGPEPERIAPADEAPTIPEPAGVSSWPSQPSPVSVQPPLPPLPQ